VKLHLVRYTLEYIWVSFVRSLLGNMIVLLYIYTYILTYSLHEAKYFLKT